MQPLNQVRNAPPILCFRCVVLGLENLQEMCIKSRSCYLEPISAEILILPPCQDELCPPAWPRALHLSHHQLLQRLAGRGEVVDEDGGGDGHVEEDKQDPHQTEVDLLTQPEEAEPQVEAHPVARL